MPRTGSTSTVSSTTSSSHRLETVHAGCDRSGVSSMPPSGTCPIVAKTSFEVNGIRATLEYPVRTMNYHDDRVRFQVDTGPLIFPDLPSDAPTRRSTAASWPTPSTTPSTTPSSSANSRRRSSDRRQTSGLDLSLLLLQEPGCHQRVLRGRRGLTKANPGENGENDPRCDHRGDAAPRPGIHRHPPAPAGGARSWADSTLTKPPAPRQQLPSVTARRSMTRSKPCSTNPDPTRSSSLVPPVMSPDIVIAAANRGIHW